MKNVIEKILKNDVDFKFIFKSNKMGDNWWTDKKK